MLQLNVAFQARLLQGGLLGGRATSRVLSCTWAGSCWLCHNFPPHKGFWVGLGCLSRMKKMLQDALGCGERNVSSAAGTPDAGLPTVLSAPGFGSANTSPVVLESSD